HAAEPPRARDAREIAPAGRRRGHRGCRSVSTALNIRIASAFGIGLKKAMKRFPLGRVAAIIVCLPTLVSLAAGPPPAALKTLLEHEGYGGSYLQRRQGNHLFATGIINGRRSAFAIDTGDPFTFVYFSS